MDLAAVTAFMSGLSFSDWLAGASALIALISFAVSRAAVRRQERLQLEALRTARDSDLIAWADGAIAAIADAQRYCRDLKNNLIMGPDAARTQSELRTRLSAFLDRGRLFFPNQPTGEEDGAPAEAAYDGAPHPAIDALYNVYRLVSDLGRMKMTPGEAVMAVVAQRRRFVSEVFVSVDPRRREAALKEMAGRR
jgi:hypothetical protein